MVKSKNANHREWNANRHSIARSITMTKQQDALLDRVAQHKGSSRAATVNQLVSDEAQRCNLEVEE